MYLNEQDDPLTAHLFSLKGDKWKELRRKIIPTFTCSKMEFMFPTIVEVANRFRNCLIKHVHQDQVEMKDLLARYTTDIIGRIIGIECDSLNNADDKFRHFGQKLFEDPRHNVWVRRLLDEYSNIGRMLRIKKVPDDISDFFMKEIRDAVEHREKNNISKNDLMDLLIQLKNEKTITFNELAAQAFVFYQAGFESSSSTLAFCLYELALNHEIQDKARRFILDAFDTFGGLTYEMMMNLPYIDQIINGNRV